MQRALINPLVMETLANVVKHALHQQPNQIDNDQQPHEEPSNDDPSEDAVDVPTVDDDDTKDPRDDAADNEVGSDENGGVLGPTLEKVVAFLHGGEAIDGLKDRDDGGEVPEGGDVDMGDEEEGKDDEEGEEEEERVVGVDGDDDEDEGEEDEGVVEDHEEGDPEEGDEEALEDAWNGGDGGGEGDRLGGVEGCDGEDDGGGGEEGKCEEEKEVGELDEEEEGPLVGGLGGVVEGILELNDERMGEEGVGEDREGEREDEGERYEVEGLRRTLWD